MSFIVEDEVGRRFRVRLCDDEDDCVVVEKIIGGRGVDPDIVSDIHIPIDSLREIAGRAEELYEYD